MVRPSRPSKKKFIAELHSVANLRRKINARKLKVELLESQIVESEKEYSSIRGMVDMELKELEKAKSDKLVAQEELVDVKNKVSVQAKELSRLEGLIEDAKEELKVIKDSSADFLANHRKDFGEEKSKNDKHISKLEAKVKELKDISRAEVEKSERHAKIYTELGGKIVEKEHELHLVEVAIEKKQKEFEELKKPDMYFDRDFADLRQKFENELQEYREISQEVADKKKELLALEKKSEELLNK